MSNMLSRFRKQGGFFQLVQVIETCEPAKRKNLLHLVASEDPGWAHLVAKKILSVEKIFGFPDHVLSVILYELPIRVLCALYVGLPAENRARIIGNLSAKVSRNFMDEVARYEDEVKDATSDEFTSASIQMIQGVRKLEADGILNFQLIDPTLVIDHKIAA